MGDLTTHFDQSEFHCKCSYQDCPKLPSEYIPRAQEVATRLEKLRDHFQATCTVISGYRCAKHNEDVGGKPHSRHLVMRAADTVFTSLADGSEVPIADVARAANDTTDFAAGGIGVYPSSEPPFTHLDLRQLDGWAPSRWDEHSA